jgi:hypothetical protein
VLKSKYADIPESIHAQLIICDVHLLVNQTNCPAGFATDEILLHNQVDGACDLNVGAYVAIGAFLILVKFLIALQHTRAWLVRKKALKKRPSQIRRLPFVPALSWFMVCCYIPFFALTWTNIGSVHNGIPAALFGLGWFCIGLLCMFYLFKFVSLGYRIIPHRIPSRVHSSDDESKDGDDSTSRFDFAGKFSVICCFIALAGQSICFVILPLVIPDDVRILRIGFGFQTWFILQHSFSITHHFQRVKNA